MQRLGLIHKLVIVFPPVDDIIRRWNTLRGRHRESQDFILPEAIDPRKTLTLAYEADGTPVVIVGKRGEWSYETALRLAALFALPGARLQDAFPRSTAVRVSAIPSSAGSGERATREA